MMQDNTVIVLDNSNYNAKYAEKVPFKAVVKYKREDVIEVVSVETGKEYELYPIQILESMDIENIRKLIDLSKYGE